MRYLTKRQILKIHQRVLEEGEDGSVLFEGAVDAAVDAPKLCLYGESVHKRKCEKAAALFHELVKRHPFIAGNKRTAYAAVDTFLKQNGRKLKASKDEAVGVCDETAKCTRNVEDLATWVRQHWRNSRPE